MAKTEPDEFAPILAGPAPSDYERYLRTDELLALQKGQIGRASCRERVCVPV